MKNNIHPKKYVRRVIFPDGLEIEFFTSDLGMRNNITLSQSCSTHPAWTGSNVHNVVSTNPKMSRFKDISI